MSLSLLPYTGSKRLDIKYFEDYLTEDITTIVEPFGGSGYLSLYLFSKNKKIKSIINDIDYELINFFNQIKKHPKQVINGYNNLITEKPTKEEFNKLINKYKSKEGTDLEKAILYLFYNKYHGIRKGLYPLDQNPKLIDMNDYEIFFNWLNNTTFTNENYSKIFKKYINKKNTFVFLDPPYFDSFNSHYIHYKKQVKEDNIIIDNTTLFIDIINFLKNTKCKVMLIINKNAITEYIYKDFIKGEYHKTYQLTKKETKHLIITNY